MAYNAVIKNEKNDKLDIAFLECSLIVFVQFQVGSWRSQTEFIGSQCVWGDFLTFLFSRFIIIFTSFNARNAFRCGAKCFT